MLWCQIKTTVRTSGSSPRHGYGQTLGQTLGKAKDIAAAVEGAPPEPTYAEVFEWCLPKALWQQASRANTAKTPRRPRANVRRSVILGSQSAFRN